jgi:hypothetical protein
MQGGDAIATATAKGGNGGNAGGFVSTTGGNGGLAIATAISAAMLGGTATATATATGGGGGAGSPPGAVGVTPGIAGAANANSFATTISGYMAIAQSTAAGSSGQAQATAQTSFSSVNSVQAIATSQVGGTASANALAQVGSTVSLPNAINPGQSFSVVNPVAVGPLTLALGSMGAGGIGGSLAYQQSASFTFNGSGAPFMIDLLGSASLGKGFDSALFQIFDNGNLMVSQSFADLASAKAFFFNKLIDIQLGAGLNNIQLAFNETMSGGEGFNFDYGTASVSATPIPSTWILMLIGLAGFGFAAYRRQRNEVPFAST